MIPPQLQYLADFMIDAKKLFISRGWHGKELFTLHPCGSIHLNIEFFDINEINGEICKWSKLENVNCDIEFFKYFKHFMEYVRPLWVKYKMGRQEIKFVNCIFKNYYGVVLNENCKIIKLIHYQK